MSQTINTNNEQVHDRMLEVNSTVSKGKIREVLLGSWECGYGSGLQIK